MKPASEGNRLAIVSSATDREVEEFQKGFDTFGVSDVYPNGVKEYYLIKRLERSLVA